MSLSCTAWKRRWWQRIRMEHVVVGIVSGCILLALAVFGWTLADSILAGAVASVGCWPAADYMGGGG